eukprot:1144784-Pelagomonas_calceolata.AAC.2
MHATHTVTAAPGNTLHLFITHTVTAAPGSTLHLLICVQGGGSVPGTLAHLKHTLALPHTRLRFNVCHGVPCGAAGGVPEGNDTRCAPQI